MRTNIDIDDELLAKAMHAGPFTTKKETVEAGLRLLARQAAYREILKWEGKLKWEGDDAIDWTQPVPQALDDSTSGPALAGVQAPRAADRVPAPAATAPRKASATGGNTKGARRAGR